MDRSDPIAEILQRIKKYPDAEVTQQPGCVTVHRKDHTGFDVTLHDEGDGFTVYYDGWHEHFDDAEEALNCFAFGLSDQCRLRVSQRMGYAHKWTVQYVEDGVWVDDSTTGMLLFPFWARPVVVFRQNTLLKGNP